MLASSLGCSMSHPADLEACLRKADPGKITSKQYDVLTQPSILALPFLPVVDEDFLPDKPEVGVCVCVSGRYVEKSLDVGVKVGNAYGSVFPCRCC